MDCATMNDGLLLGEVRNQLIRDVESGREVSYCDFEFLVVPAGSIYRVHAIELQGFSKRCF